MIIKKDFYPKKERKHEKTNVSAASKKPGAVTGFTAKSDHNDGGIKLKWKKVRNAKYYEIYWKKSKKGKFERYWSTTSTPDYSFGIGSDFQLGKTYYFKVRAVSGNKNGKFSPVRSIIVPKKVEITMDNWMQYYELSPCNSSIDYNAFGEIEFLDHQHTLQLKNNYILHP